MPLTRLQEDRYRSMAETNQQMKSVIYDADQRMASTTDFDPGFSVWAGTRWDLVKPKEHIKSTALSAARSGFVAGMTKAGMLPVQALAALGGSDWDAFSSSISFGRLNEQAQAAAFQDTWVKKSLYSGMQSLGQTITLAAAAAPVAGVAGGLAYGASAGVGIEGIAAGLATAQTASTWTSALTLATGFGLSTGFDSYNVGKASGFKDADALNYALTQGFGEAVPTLLTAGFGKGFTSMISKLTRDPLGKAAIGTMVEKATAVGTAKMMAVGFTKNMAAEIAEEGVTEVLQYWSDHEFLGAERSAQDWMTVGADLFGSILVSMGAGASLRGMGQLAGKAFGVQDETPVSAEGRRLAYDVLDFTSKNGLSTSAKNAEIVQAVMARQNAKETFSDVDTESELTAIEVLDSIGKVEVDEGPDGGRRFTLAPEATTKQIEEARTVLHRLGLSTQLAVLEQAVNDAALTDYLVETAENIEDVQPTERPSYRFSTDAPEFATWDAIKSKITIGGNTIEGFTAQRGISKMVKAINLVSDQITPDQMNELKTILENNKTSTGSKDPTKAVKEFMQRSGLTQTTDLIMQRLDKDAVQKASDLQSGLVPMIKQFVTKVTMDIPQIQALRREATDAKGLVAKVTAELSPEMQQKVAGLALKTARPSTIGPEIIDNVVDMIAYKVFQDMTEPVMNARGEKLSKIRALKKSEGDTLEAAKLLEATKRGWKADELSPETIYIANKINESLENVVRDKGIAAEISKAVDGWTKAGRYFEEDKKPTLDEFFAEHASRRFNNYRHVDVYQRFVRLKDLLGRISGVQEEAEVTGGLTSQDRLNLNRSISKPYIDAYDGVQSYISGALYKGRITEAQASGLFQELEDMSVNIWQDLTPQEKAEVIQSRGKVASVKDVLRKIYIKPDAIEEYEEDDLKKRFSVGFGNEVNRLIDLIQKDPTISQQSKDALFRLDNPESIAFKALQTFARNVTQAGETSRGRAMKAAADIELLQTTLEDLSDVRHLSPVANNLFDELDKMIIRGRRRPVMASIRDSFKKLAKAGLPAVDIDNYFNQNILDPIFNITDLQKKKDGTYKLKSGKNIAIPGFAHRIALSKAFLDEKRSPYVNRDALKFYLDRGDVASDIINQIEASYKTMASVISALPAPEIDKARTLAGIQMYRDIAVHLYSDKKVLGDLVNRSLSYYNLSSSQITKRKEFEAAKELESEKFSKQKDAVEKAEAFNELKESMTPEERSMWGRWMESDPEFQREGAVVERKQPHLLDELRRKQEEKRKGGPKQTPLNVPAARYGAEKTKQIVEEEPEAKLNRVVDLYTEPEPLSAEAKQRAAEFELAEPQGQEPLRRAKPLETPQVVKEAEILTDLLTLRDYLVDPKSTLGKNAFAKFQKALTKKTDPTYKKALKLFTARDVKGLTVLAESFRNLPAENPLRFSAENIKHAMEGPFTTVRIGNLLTMLDHFGLEMEYLNTDSLRKGDVDPNAENPDALVRAYVNLEAGRITVTNRATLGDIGHEIGHYILEGLALPPDLKRVVDEHYSFVEDIGKRREMRADDFGKYLADIETKVPLPSPLKRVFNFMKQQLLRLFNFLALDNKPLRQMSINDIYEMALNGSLSRFNVKGLGASEGRKARFSLVGAEAYVANLSQSEKYELGVIKNWLSTSGKNKTLSQINAELEPYGFFMGLDGKLRKEVNFDPHPVVSAIYEAWQSPKFTTGAVRYSPMFTLGEILPGDFSLFQLYPAMKDVSIKIARSVKSGAEYDHNNRTITLNEGELAAGYIDVMNTIAHEIQHVVQAEENLLYGSSTEAIAKKVSEEDAATHWTLYALVPGEIEARVAAFRDATSNQRAFKSGAVSLKLPTLSRAFEVEIEKVFESLKDLETKPSDASLWLAVTETGRETLRFSAEDPRVQKVDEIARMLDKLPQEAWKTIVKDFTKAAVDQAKKDGVEITPAMIYTRIKALHEASGKKFLSGWLGLDKLGPDVDGLFMEMSKRALAEHLDLEQRKEAKKPLMETKAQLRSYITSTIRVLRKGTGDPSYAAVTAAVKRMAEKQFGNLTAKNNLTPDQIKELISISMPGMLEGEQSAGALVDKLVQAQIEVIKARELGKIIKLLRETVGDSRLSGDVLRTAAQMYEDDWNVKPLDIVLRTVTKMKPRPRKEVVADLRDVSQRLNTGGLSKQDIVELSAAQQILRKHLSEMRAAEAYDQKVLDFDSPRGTVSKLWDITDRIKSGYGRLLSIREEAKRLGIPEFGARLVAFGSSAENVCNRLRTPLRDFSSRLHQFKKELGLAKDDNRLGWASLLAYEGDPRFFESSEWKSLPQEIKDAALALGPQIKTFYDESPNDPEIGARALTQNEIGYDIDQILHRRNKLIEDYRRRLKDLSKKNTKKEEEDLLKEIENYEVQLQVLSDPAFHYVNIPKSVMGNAPMKSVDFETRSTLSLWQVFINGKTQFGPSVKGFRLDALNPIDVMGEYAQKMARKIAIAEITEWIKTSGLAVPVAPGTERAPDGYVLGKDLQTTLKGFAVEENVAKLFGDNIIGDGMLPRRLQHIFHITKIANFTTPFVLGMSNLKQGLILRAIPFKDYKEAWEKMKNPFDPDVIEFAKSGAKSTTSMDYEESDRELRMLKQNDGVLWHYLRRASMIDPALKVLNGDISGGLRQLIGDNPVVTAYVASHHIAWATDELQRFAAYLGKKRSLGKDMTSFEIGREVASVFADYGDIPKNTRSILGVLGFTPNYRINMVKMAGLNAVQTAKWIHAVATGRSTSASMKTGMLNMMTHLTLIGLTDFLLTQAFKFERDDDDKWWKTLYTAGLRYKKDVYVEGQGWKEGVLKLGGPISSIQREVDLIVRPFEARYAGDVPTEIYRGALTMAHPIYRTIGEVMTGMNSKGERIWNVADSAPKQLADRAAHLVTTLVPMLDLWFSSDPGFADSKAREALLGHWANTFRGMLDYEAVPYLRDPKRIRQMKQVQYDMRRFIEDAVKTVESGKQIPDSWKSFRPSLD